MRDRDALGTSFHGPKARVLSALIGAAVGLGVSWLVPGVYAEGATQPVIPLWLVSPFAGLLLSIAVMPFLAGKWWHRHYPDVSLFLGAAVTAYFLGAFGVPGFKGSASFGSYTMLHAGIEYYAFIALVGGLYLASGGIVVEVKGRGRPFVNTFLLGAGAVLSNFVGTTGASVLLIRPFMRVNAGRLVPMHVVFFIFIVSNCGGTLTPIGDPPLYLGYLKGVPFFWTVEHLLRDWLVVVGLLLAAFFLFDSRIKTVASGPDGSFSVKARGAAGIVGMTLLIAGVFIDPLLKTTSAAGYPVGATFQILVALITYKVSSPANRSANGFTLEPIKEVGLLFAGIFATMAPALAYLATHGSSLGLTTPTAFFFGTGTLSAVLDNAPTYLNLLQIAIGEEITPTVIKDYLATASGALTLRTISTAAVFFGAMTYIGNGPNLMVKAIAESAGVRMPSFFGYLGRALAVLLPILVLHWFLFIR
jgi:Na+/H+ antiporter NhaD/arsenite permease-like protein